MFNSLKKLNQMKEKIKKIREDIASEGILCDEFLSDLPEDISSIEELEDIIGNNKDMSRSYDLGRRDALREIQQMLQKLTD